MSSPAHIELILSEKEVQVSETVDLGVILICIGSGAGF